MEVHASADAFIVTVLYTLILIYTYIYITSIQFEEDMNKKAAICVENMPVDTHCSVGVSNLYASDLHFVMGMILE